MWKKPNWKYFQAVSGSCAAPDLAVISAYQRLWEFVQWLGIFSYRVLLWVFLESAPWQKQICNGTFSSTHNKAWLCKVMHCCAGTELGSGPRGEMPQRYSSPGPLRQTSEWERRVRKSSAYNSTLVWFGLPFPTASNVRVVPSLSKPFETLRRPPKTLPAVWLLECWNRCWWLWSWDNPVSWLPGRGASLFWLLCHISQADCKTFAATAALSLGIFSAPSAPGSWVKDRALFWL